ncbi:MAG: rhodanese-like domain-containing protein, partial [Actinomycetes bacterium]
MAGTVSARTLREWLNDGSEIAVLDVRDGGPYSRGHILVASGVPRAVMETTVPRLLPRRSVRVVLTDEDGSTLAGAAALMESAGYTGIHLLEGGNAGWTAAGYR